MDTSETCPRCGATFLARKTLVSHGLRVGRSWLRRGGPEVRCPHCWHESEAQHLRLFGLIPTHQLRWVVIAILAVCVLVLFVQKGQV